MSYPELTPVVARGTTQPRYVADRFADIVNVMDFGAKADGDTDDTAAFRAAAMSNGEIDLTAESPTVVVVHVPDGTYKLSSDPVPELSEENDAYGAILSSKFNLYWELGRNVVLTGNGKLHGVVKRDHPGSRVYNWFSKWQMDEGGRTHEWPNYAKIEVLSEDGEFLDCVNITSATQTKHGSASIQRDYTSIFCAAVHNHATRFHRVWGLYAEAIKANGNGQAIAAEIDPVNAGDDYYPVSPYGQHPRQSIGVQVCAGAEYPGLSHKDCSAAIQIAGDVNSPSNGVSQFGIGINFLQLALRGISYNSQTQKYSGYAVAIAMGKGHGIAWYSEANKIAAGVTSQVEDYAQGSSLVFADGYYFIENTNNHQRSLQINHGASATKGFLVDCNNDPGSLNLIASSPSTCDIGVFPTDGGYIKLGVSQTSGALTCDRYIKIKDRNGNVLKIPCTV